MKNYIQSTYVKTARSELGLTQSAMAEKLGVTRHAIESWEQGRRTPSETALKLLEYVLNDRKNAACPQCGKIHRPGYHLDRCREDARFAVDRFTVRGLSGDDPKMITAKKEHDEFERYYTFFS